MNYLPKTAYWRPLVPNDESVDETTNPYFKNRCAPSVAEDEADFVLVKHIFQYATVSLRSQKLTKT